jgi:hypothetical protein
MSATRFVLRNARFKIIGGLSLLLTAGFVVLVLVVLSSPTQDIDHPDRFSSGGRTLAVIGCLLAVGAFGVYTIGSLRVALIMDTQGLTIRNPYRTTRVGWDAKPKFEVRGRSQDVRISSPVTTTNQVFNRDADMTYRYREVVCTLHGKQIWIAAASRMRHRERADDLLATIRQKSTELRQAGRAG